MRFFLASTWFQLCWFTAVLGTYQWQWVTVCLTLVTLVYCIFSDARSLKRIVIVTVIGLVVDSLNQRIFVLNFPTNWLPIWLLCLWALFAWYAYQLKSVLYRFPKIYVSLVGGLGGGASYYAGYKLQAVEFSYGVVLTIMMLFIEWCFVMFLILKVYGNEKIAGKLNQEPD